MLEPPAISDALLLAGVRAEYGLPAATLTFLPLGADVNSAVYRLVAQDSRAYFLKLRKGGFAEALVLVPQYLYEKGVRAVIPALPAHSGQLWARIEEFWVILYPFIDGKDGYQTGLSDRQWVEFGENLGAIHRLQIPTNLRQLIPEDNFSPHWRERVRYYQALVETTGFTDPVAAQLAAFMRSRQAEISRVVDRAEQLAQQVQSRSLDFVLCHADIHAGNLLIAQDGPVYIVDWDAPMLAPKERDLALIGGSGAWRGKHQQRLFYSGYGSAEVDPAALAYYRYERIATDIAEFSNQLLGSSEGNEDRAQSLGYFVRTFSSGQEVELAFEGDIE